MENIKYRVLIKKKEHGTIYDIGVYRGALPNEEWVCGYLKVEGDAWLAERTCYFSGNQPACTDLTNIQTALLEYGDTAESTALLIYFGKLVGEIVENKSVVGGSLLTTDILVAPLNEFVNTLLPITLVEEVIRDE